MITLTKLRPYTGDVVASSPNHDDRNAQEIDGIVLRATSDAGDEARSLSWLCSPESRASSHLLVNRAGRVTRLVGDQQRAWHAGFVQWRGASEVNSVTLGIAIANRNDGEPYTDEQYGRVAAIVAHYCRQGLSLDDVVSHGEFVASRDADPLGWDWERFRTMVEQQLRAATDLEVRSSLIYDRRSADRRAADEAAADGSTDMPPPSVAPPPTPEPVTAAVKPPVPAEARKAGTRPAPRTAAAITPPKPALRSRTLWLNGVTVLVAGSLIVGQTLDAAHWVGITLSVESTMWALLGVGALNILLRLQTASPIGSLVADRDHPRYALDPAEQERLAVLRELRRR